MNAAADKRPASPLEHGFVLGEMRVDPQGGEVRGPGGQQKLDPKVMAVLAMLAEHAGHVVAREDLLARLWPNVVVSDDALSRCLYELRRQLSLAGGSEELRALVETLPKRGYRLNAAVKPLPAAPEPGTAARRWPQAAGWAAAAAAIVLLAILGYRGVVRQAPGPGPAYTIAVLPFADLSERGDQAYFSDGTSVEILKRLDGSPHLNVLGRESTFRFRERPLDVAAIAARLNVTHVLDGSVHRSGDRIRVRAELIAVPGGEHVWSDSYEQPLDDVQRIPDDIAAAVAGALQAQLGPAEGMQRPQPKFEVYDLVLRAEELYFRRGPGDVERSIELLEDAVKRDPGYARAWANLAGAYSFVAWQVDPPSEVLRARQGDAAHRAVKLEPSLALAHARLAQFYDESGDAGKHREHAEIAYKLDPDNLLVLGYMASDAVESGDYPAAIELQKRALMLDPMNTVSRQNLGVYQMAAGRLDEALTNYKAVLELNPDAGDNLEIEIPRILVLQGHFDQAAAAALKLPAGKYRDQAMALLHKSPAHRGEADAALRRLEDYVPVPPMDVPEHTSMDAVRLAEVYAYRGANDKAFATLMTTADDLRRRSEADTFLWYLRQEARLAPFLKPLHADPRWAGFMQEPI